MNTKVKTVDILTDYVNKIKQNCQRRKCKSYLTVVYRGLINHSIYRLKKERKGK